MVVVPCTKNMLGNVFEAECPAINSRMKDFVTLKRRLVIDRNNIKEFMFNLFDVVPSFSLLENANNGDNLIGLIPKDVYNKDLRQYFRS